MSKDITSLIQHRIPLWAHEEVVHVGRRNLSPPGPLPDTASVEPKARNAKPHCPRKSWKNWRMAALAKQGHGSSPRSVPSCWHQRNGTEQESKSTQPGVRLQLAIPPTVAGVVDGPQALRVAKDWAATA